MAKIPRKLSLVKLKKKWAAEPALQGAAFFNDMPLVYLGEIPNMAEHGIFVSYRSGRIYSGLHIFYFVELSETET